MCLIKNTLYQYFVLFLPCLGQLPIWKHSIYSHIALKTHLNYEKEILDILFINF